MADRSVTHHDLEVLRDILALTRPGTTGTTATDAGFMVLELLEHLLRSDFLSFQEMQVGPGKNFRRFLVQTTVEKERLLLGEDWLATYDTDNSAGTLQEYWWTLPCSLVDRTGLPQLTSIRMFFGEREWAVHPAQVDYLHVVDEILLAYPLAGGRSLRVLTGRDSGRPYGLRELTLTELLLPHLRPLLEAVRAENAVPGAQALPFSLTARQQEILHMVALGMTNKQVGRHIGISEGTVRKHLENAYSRLAVQSRTEAVFRLRAHETATAR